MYLRELRLENYRNYEKETIQFINGINIFLGKNAQGKTNIIESIYFSSFAKSYRADKDNELIMFNKDFLKVGLEYFDNNLNESRNIETYIDTLGRKKIIVDDIVVKKIHEHIENLPVVIFSPESMDIVKGPPQKRRKFMDMVGSQFSKSYYINLQEYLKCLKLKNTLLKKEYVDKEYIFVLHEKMSEYIQNIVKLRKNILDLLLKKSETIQKRITNNKENINIIYKSDFLNLTKDEIKTLLDKYYDIDILRKASVKGIQKDDFEIYINNLDISKYGSQGQCRTALLTLKLADFEVLKDEKGQAPILLLDDIMSELDSSRIEFLLNYIKDYQSVITTTDVDFLKDKSNIKIEKVLNGTLEK
jgi:DNA replication and repair protein RecF